MLYTKNNIWIAVYATLNNIIISTYICSRSVHIKFTYVYTNSIVVVNISTKWNTHKHLWSLTHTHSLSLSLSLALSLSITHSLTYSHALMLNSGTYFVLAVLGSASGPLATSPRRAPYSKLFLKTSHFVRHSSMATEKDCKKIVCVCVCVCVCVHVCVVVLKEGLGWE